MILHDPIVESVDAEPWLTKKLHVGFHFMEGWYCNLHAIQGSTVFPNLSKGKKKSKKQATSLVPSATHWSLFTLSQTFNWDPVMYHLTTANSLI